MPGPRPDPGKRQAPVLALARVLPMPVPGILPPALPGRPTRRLTVVTANLCYGGLDPETGDDLPLEATVGALRRARPHAVLLQEVGAAGNPSGLWRRLRRIANALGMEPAVLGPSAAIRSELGNHTAILVAAGRGLRVTDQWPPPSPAGPRVPWCRAEVTVPGLAGPLHLYSAHLSARSPSARVHAAELIASYAAGHAGHVVAGGDWTTTRAPGPGPAQIAALPAAVRASRCRQGPDGAWAPRYDVDAPFAAAGLADLAACHDPAGLAATTRDGARADRCYATPALAGVLAACQDLVTGSDHRAVAVTFDLTGLQETTR